MFQAVRHSLVARRWDIDLMDLLERPERLVQRHPWEVVRFRFFADLAKTRGHSNRPQKVLDVGSGDGFVARQLMPELVEGSSIVCWDIHYTDDDIRSLTQQSPDSIRFQVEMPEEQFDLVLLLDVLEHVPDDVAFLRRIADRHLHPGASIIISVPAWQVLFSNHDRALKHYRRYSRHDGIRLVRESGLRLVASGGLFYSLFLPRVVGKLSEKIMGSGPDSNYAVDQWTAGSLVTTMVLSVMRWDCRVARLLSRAGLGFPGLSWWAVCVKA